AARSGEARLHAEGDRGHRSGAPAETGLRRRARLQEPAAAPLGELRERSEKTARDPQASRPAARQGHRTEEAEGDRSQLDRRSAKAFALRLKPRAPSAAFARAARASARFGVLNSRPPGSRSAAFSSSSRHNPHARIVELALSASNQRGCRMASKILRIVVRSATLLLLAAPHASAQAAATGSIEGVVTDPSGGVLPGVTVTVRNMGTNVTREMVTDGSGRYRIAALQPGRYEVSASLSGFEVKPVSNVEVLVGQTAPVDLRMHPAGVAEEVTVVGESPVIDTRRTDVSNVVSETAMENLPVTGRRWDNFVLLSPGVTNDGNFGLVSYRGISGLYNNNMVDGVDNNQAFFSEARGRTRIAYSISESSIKEFQVGVSNMSAEFGRSAGGTVNAVTKSGTNNFSGEGFYFLRDKAFQSRNPFIVLPNDPNGKPDERRQQFGVALGGPIQ